MSVTERVFVIREVLIPPDVSGCRAPGSPVISRDASGATVHPGAAAPAPPPPCDPLISSATDLAELICGHAAPDRHRPDSRARANSFAAAKLSLVQRGICGHGRLRIRQSDWDRTAT